MLQRVKSLGSRSSGSAIPDLDCLRVGWLNHAQRGGHAGYRRRYVRLTLDALTISRDESTAPELTVPTSGISAARPSTLPTAKHNSFDVETHDALHSFEAADAAEYAQWVDDVRLAARLEPPEEPAGAADESTPPGSPPGDAERPRLGSAAALEPSAWVPDSSYSRCRRCKVKFSALTRRHHCRRCGHVFCARCARKSYKKVAPGYDRPVRHCVDCFTESGGPDLRAENDQLKRRIARMESESNLADAAGAGAPETAPPSLDDIQSPLSMITTTLHNMAHDPAFCEREPRAAADIAHVVTVLRTNEDIYKLDARVLASADEETRAWLVERFDLHRVASRRSVSAPPAAEALQRREATPVVASAASSIKRVRRASLEGPVARRPMPQPPGPPPLEGVDASVTDDLLRRSEAAFDVLAFADTVNGAPLRVALCWCIEHHSLASLLPLVPNRIEPFCARLDASYRQNPYHNSAHGADVLMSTHHRLIRDPLASRVPSHELLGMLLAAAAHDADHPGVSNKFLAASRDKLAIRYNDRNVLENHHCATLFQLLLSTDLNFTERLPRAMFTAMRALAIDAILATDLKEHFEHVSRFTERLEAGPEDPISLGGEADRHLVLVTLLKVADLGHSFKATQHHLRWSERITEEFYAMGDLERAQGLPISPFCDRTLGQLRKSQLGFIDFLVRPLVTAWCGYVGHDAELRQVEINRAWWDEYRDGDELFDDGDEDTPDGSPGPSPRTSVTITGAQKAALAAAAAAGGNGGGGSAGGAGAGGAGAGAAE